jgi:hypothetical protein
MDLDIKQIENKQIENNQIENKEINSTLDLQKSHVSNLIKTKVTQNFLRYSITHKLLTRIQLKYFKQFNLDLTSNLDIDFIYNKIVNDIKDIGKIIISLKAEFKSVPNLQIRLSLGCLKFLERLKKMKEEIENKEIENKEAILFNLQNEIYEFLFWASSELNFNDQRYKKENFNTEIYFLSSMNQVDIINSINLISEFFNKNAQKENFQDFYYSIILDSNSNPGIGIFYKKPANIKVIKSLTEVEFNSFKEQDDIIKKFYIPAFTHYNPSKNEYEVSHCRVNWVALHRFRSCSFDEDKRFYLPELIINDRLDFGYAKTDNGVVDLNKEIAKLNNLAKKEIEEGIIRTEKNNLNLNLDGTNTAYAILQFYNTSKTLGTANLMDILNFNEET